MLYKTKLFSSQYIVEKDEATGLWDMTGKSDDIDTQINDWVDTTGNRIFSSSAPAMHAEWTDNTFKRKTIIISLVVIYVPEEDLNVGEYPEYRA
jgi:monomeric isocitrate dehydrogenase